MIENPQYEQTIGDKILNLLKANQHFAFFRSFYYGDPIDIPISAYPCIVVDPIETSIVHDATQTDKLTQAYEIKLMYNKRDEFGKDTNEVYGTRKLQEFAEGLNPETGYYDDRTVAGILRKNFTLGNIATDQEMSINYDLTPRPNNQLSAEAQIRFVVERLVYVTNRV